MTTTDRVPLITRLEASDYGLHALLVMLLLAMFAAPALVGFGPLREVVIDAFFSVAVVGGVVAVARRGDVPRVAIAVALVAVAARWVRLGTSDPWIEQVDVATSGAIVAVLAWLILVRVFAAGPISVARIEGAVAVYLLLGVFWGCAYQLVWHSDHRAFATAAGALADPAALFYFSFSTLTTVGYGDVVPQTPAARSLASLEALVGQLYPVVLIGRLVSMELSAHQAGGGRS